MNKQEVENQDKYLVRIGSDLFEVEAEDNQRARYKAAQLFKEKYQLKTWLTNLVDYARAKLVTPPEVEIVTSELLKLIKERNGQTVQEV